MPVKRQLLVFYFLLNAFSGESFVSKPHSFQSGGKVIDSRQARTTKLYTAEIASAWTTIDALWESSPYAAAALTCGFKASAADFVAQKRQYRKRNEKQEEQQADYELQQQEQASTALETTMKTTVSVSPGAGTAAAVLPTQMVEEQMDFKRNVAYLTYGAIYQGVSQEFIYNHLYPVMFGRGTEVPVVLTKVAFDLLIQTTLVTLPVAYVTKALIFKYPMEEAFRRYKDDILNHGLLIKYFSIWGPVQCLTFSIIPEHWRVTFIAFVSFFWLIILSSIASRAEQTIMTTAADGETASQDYATCDLEDGYTCNIDG